MLLESWVCWLFACFPPIDCNSAREQTKKSVIWQPWSQRCFLPAKINGYRKSERRRRGPPYGLLCLRASFSLVWWSATDKSFLTEAKLRGSNNSVNMGEYILALQFTKNRLRWKTNKSLSFSTLLDRSPRPMDCFKFMLEFDGWRCLGVFGVLKVLSHRCTCLLSVSFSLYHLWIEVVSCYSKRSMLEWDCSRCIFNRV